MRRKEAIAALTCALLVAGALLAPVVVGYRTAREEGSVFLGMIRSDDYHRYGSFMDQAREEGRTAFLDRSAVEYQDGRIVAVVFWLLGRLARILGLPAVRLFQALVPGGALLLVALLWPWTGRLSIDFRTRIAAWLLLFLGSGLEWLAPASWEGALRLRNAWMDGFSTFTLHHNPLKVVAVATAAWVLGSGIRWELGGLRGFPWSLALGLPVLWWVHPNTAITAYMALLFWAVWLLLYEGAPSPRRLLVLGASVLPGALLVAGQILWMRQDPVVAHVITCYQVPGLAEPLGQLAVRYGLLGVLALVGVATALRRQSVQDRMLLAWLLAALLSARIPFLTGLLFAHTLHAPVALLAALGLGRLWRARRPGWRVLGWGLGAAALATSLVGDGLAVRQICRQTREDVWPTSLYLTRDEHAAALRLRRLPEGAVLATRDAGMKLAWLAAKPVLLGHWGTTPGRRLKEEALARFHDPGAGLEEKLTILRRYGIRYVFRGPREARLGELDPALPLVHRFTQGDVQCWEVEGWRPLGPGEVPHPKGAGPRGSLGRVP